MKLAVFVVADPRGGDESLARLFNALAVASEAKEAGDEVALTFIGTGTRWPEELARLEHPAHGLFDSLREVIRGASCGCAAFWQATESVESCGLPLLKEATFPGTEGIASVRQALSAGFQTLVF